LQHHGQNVHSKRHNLPHITNKNAKENAKRSHKRLCDRVLTDAGSFLDASLTEKEERRACSVHKYNHNMRYKKKPLNWKKERQDAFAVAPTIDDWASQPMPTLSSLHSIKLAGMKVICAEEIKHGGSSINKDSRRVFINGKQVPVLRVWCLQSEEMVMLLAISFIIN